ncbi:MAG: phenylacetic acid degradation protein, partial [Cupriavidus necator]
MSSQPSAEIIPAAPGTLEKPYFGIDVPLMRYFGLQPELIEEGYC